MPESILKQFYAYRIQPWSDVARALNDLASAEVAMRSKNLSGVDKLYSYANPLVEIASSNESKEVLSSIDRETLRFLDAGAIWQWLRDPTDLLAGELLSSEVAFIAAATNNVSRVDASPYTLEEIAAIADGTASSFDDLLFLRTLRGAMGYPEDKRYGVLLFGTLPKVENRSDLVQPYSWDDALFFSILLQSVWKSFSILSFDEQKSLLRQYFYMGIVAGVPVRRWVREAVLANQNKALETGNAFLQAILASVETVPFDTEDTEGELFSDILKDFFVSSNKEQVITVAQENFIQSLYKDQPESDLFASWIREALFIVSGLKNAKLN